MHFIIKKHQPSERKTLRNKKKQVPLHWCSLNPPEFIDLDSSSEDFSFLVYCMHAWDSFLKQHISIEPSDAISHARGVFFSSEKSPQPIFLSPIFFRGGFANSWWEILTIMTCEVFHRQLTFKACNQHEEIIIIVELICMRAFTGCSSMVDEIFWISQWGSHCFSEKAKLAAIPRRASFQLNSCSGKKFGKYDQSHSQSQPH